jgi:hypothetical protein
MNAELPSITEQRQLCYRPHIHEVEYVYDRLNYYLFDYSLAMPEITLGSCKQYWGMCSGYHELQSYGTACTLKLMDKWFCAQWMVTTLAHEMAHQFEWDVLEKDMTHRQSFFIHRDRMAEYGISLKTAHRMRKWFLYQDLFYC